MAVFLEARRYCRLRYQVIADPSFETRSAWVEGSIGRQAVRLRIRRMGSRWIVGSDEVDGPAGLVDLDLGFTPATNTLAIRRLSLSVGEASEAPAAYLAFPRLRLGVIRQRYKRLSRFEYEYAAPQFGYKGVLKVSRFGAVVHYPGLFEKEAPLARP